MAERRIARRMPRWLAALPVSLVLHGVVLLAVAAAVRREEPLPALMIDLNAIVADAHDSTRSHGASGSRGGPLASTSSAESRSARGARSPRSAPPGSPPSSPATASDTTRSATPRPATSTSLPAPTGMPTPRQDSERPKPPAPAMPAPPEPIPAPPERHEPTSSGPTEPPRDIPPSAAPSGSAGGTKGGTAPGSADDAAAGVGARDPNGSASGGAAAIGGDRLSLAVPGSGDGGTEYSAYLSRLRERLQQGLRYPPSAQRRGISGTVQLEIAIEADGAVSSVALAESSSHESLDRAALEAGRALARQPFPADVRPRPLTVRVPVTFKLQ